MPGTGDGSVDRLVGNIELITRPGDAQQEDSDAGDREIRATRATLDLFQYFLGCGFAVLSLGPRRLPVLAPGLRHLSSNPVSINANAGGAAFAAPDRVRDVSRLLPAALFIVFFCAHMEWRGQALEHGFGFQHAERRMCRL